MKKIKIIVVIAIILGIIVSIYAANIEKKEYKIEKISEYKYHILYTNEKMGVIDQKGKIIVEPKYDYIQLPNPSKEVFICEKDGETKVFNEKQEEIYKEYKGISAIQLQSKENEIEYEKSTLTYKKDKKVGIINIDGEKITEPIYDEITSLKYKEGELLVKQNNNYGVINCKGTQIIDFKYDMIEGDKFVVDEDYSQEGYITRQKTSNGYKYGYINHSGKELLKNEYNNITRITENPEYNDIYLIARKGGQVGVIKNDKEIIKFEYQDITYDSGLELLIDRKGEKYGVYNMEGNQILKSVYNEVWVKGIYIYAKDEKNEYYFNQKGEKIENNQYISVNKTLNDNYLITINNDGLCGVLDKNENVKIKNKYTYLEYLFDEYFIAAKEDNKFGIINENDDKIIDFQYDVLFKIKDSQIVQGRITDSNKLDLYNGKLENIYSKENATLYVKDEFIQVISDNEFNYFDFEGRKMKSSQIYSQNRLFAVCKNGKWGFEDSYGNLKVECIYDEVTEFNKYGFAGIKQNEKWGVIDDEEKIILAPTYEIDSSYMKPEFIGKYFKQSYDTGEIYYTEI